MYGWYWNYNSMTNIYILFIKKMNSSLKFQLIRDLWFDSVILPVSFFLYFFKKYVSLINQFM
jgi:hypothetical protein